MRYLITIFLVGAAVACVVIFGSEYFYNQSLNEDEEEQQIVLLERAKKLNWGNDKVYAELGKIYFDLGVESLGRDEDASDFLKKSVDYFAQALKINPFNHIYQLNYSQSLQYWETYTGSAPTQENILERYKKAAALSGDNIDVLYETSKVLMTQWKDISPDERQYMINVLQGILEGRRTDRLHELLNIWALNSGDYEVMSQIIPDNSNSLKRYAKFLGERSLSLEERRKVLARAEYLDFIEARQEHGLGESSLDFFRIEEAQKHLGACRRLLKNIKFYQDLSGNEYIDQKEYQSLWYLSGLNSAKAKLESGAGLKEVEQDILDYVGFEGSVPELDRLKSYLQAKGVIEKSPEDSFNDLDKTAFHLTLLFRQNRYRDIIRVGKTIEQSLVVPEEKKDAFVKILLLVGDSYRKTDYVYNALEMYQKAYELDGSNLRVLDSLRQNYEWLNRAEDVKRIEQEIESLLADKRMDLSSRKIAKGRDFTQRMLLKGDRVNITLAFDWGQQAKPPLVSILFNGRLKWEDYLDSPEVTVVCDSEMGMNSVTVSPVNSEVVLEAVEWE